jgi:hypothetical protein
MKKTKRKQLAEDQINEFVLGIAKALLGKKMQTVTKLMQHDPALKKAVERYADDVQRFRDHLERTYGYDSPEELAQSMKSSADDLIAKHKKLKKQT